jgi:hypothetical protein
LPSALSLSENLPASSWEEKKSFTPASEAITGLVKRPSAIFSGDHEKLNIAMISGAQMFSWNYPDAYLFNIFQAPCYYQVDALSH